MTEEIENVNTEIQENSVQKKETTLHDDIKSAIKEVSNKEVKKPLETKPEAEYKNEEKSPDKKDIAEDVSDKNLKITDAPNSLSAVAKSKWKDVPEEIRQEFAKREKDVEKMFTSHDGELRLGREIKEVITPYMAIIQSEGGTPATAVKDLLNTAYILRTGSPQQKAHLLHQVAKDYGIDLNQSSQENIDPSIQQLQQQIYDLQQKANPDVIRKHLQEQMENDTVQKEWQTFAANPKHTHLNVVKPAMAALLGSGQAKDYQEAYDAACWANPQIRSTLQATTVAEQEAKRKTELASKRNAAVSVTGSPGITVPNTGSPNRTLNEEIRAAMREVMSS